MKGKTEEHLKKELESLRQQQERTEEELKVRVRQQAAVVGAGLHALSCTDLQALMDEVVGLCATTLGVKYCKVLELLPGGKELLFRSAVGWKKEFVGKKKITAGEGSPGGFALLQKEPLIVEDFDKEERFCIPPIAREYGIKCGTSIVIYGKKQPFGVLCLHSDKKCEFTSDDVNFLQSMANLLAGAIERKKLDANEKRVAITAAFARACRDFVELDPVFELAVSSLAKELDISRASVWLIGDKGDLVCQKLHEHPADTYSEGTVLSGKDYPEYMKAVLKDEPIDAHDARTDPRTKEFMDGYFVSLDIHSMLDIPLRLKGELSGVLCLEQTGSPRYWREDEMDFVNGIVAQVSIAVSSFTERMKLQERLDYMKQYDAATGLPNRILFRDRLNQAIAHARQKKQKVGVIVVHSGRMEEMCKLMGAGACDELLKTVAARLEESVCGGDGGTCSTDTLTKTVGRLSEYEFGILLLEIASAEEAARVAQGAIDALSGEITLAGRKFVFTCNLGISLYPSDGVDEDALLTNASMAASQVKASEKSDYLFYSPDMGARVSGRMALEEDLRRALEREEFLVYYQPQVDIDTGEVVGVEALVRWLHPERGLVSPGEFIPLLEDTGLIVPLGEWVLRAACIQSREWYDTGLTPIIMSVNFSSIQFQRQNIVELIKRVTKETGINPHYLEVEVTESGFMKGSGVTVATLTELNEMGVKIAIDDFGTGYSSLSYLKQLPVSKLKVDQSFVRDLTKNHDDDALVTAIIAMGHSLKLKVIAEGVETKEQLEFLRALKCDEIQGYLFSRPLPAEEATKLLAEGKRLEL